MVEEKTSTPNLLTEIELVALMDKHGMGTDATHAEHIDTNQIQAICGFNGHSTFHARQIWNWSGHGLRQYGFPIVQAAFSCAPTVSQLATQCIVILLNNLLFYTFQRDIYKSIIWFCYHRIWQLFKVAIERANLIDDSLAHHLDERSIQTEQSPWITFVISGHLFYKCAKPQSGCNFFLWVSDNAEPEDNAANEHSSWKNNDGSGPFSHIGTSNYDWGNPSTNDVICQCNQPAQKTLDDPNKGRQFYRCPKGMNSTCNEQMRMTLVVARTRTGTIPLREEEGIQHETESLKKAMLPRGSDLPGARESAEIAEEKVTRRTDAHQMDEQDFYSITLTV
ncbi:hypothetical protein DBV15_02784 [Temnothorax longispinosus]|uniref:GRF-type domain-containing protein n=1 Tax=Temnothorax longispinosus TaxID=300112 RepID=A0A4S2KG70_9HYME|nr:hypothetical protein DBV15_02784 [Temnothorax longispinosus]